LSGASSNGYVFRILRIRMLDISKLTSLMNSRVQDSVRGVVQAGSDAARAWTVAPTHYYHDAKGSRRPFTTRERLRLKYETAKAAFSYSRLITEASTILVRQMGTEGLLANLLHVIEVLHRSRPDANVYVDWTLRGTEKGFRYGAVGSEVWSGLFKPIGVRPQSPAFPADYAVDLTLWGTGRDRLGGQVLQNQRNAYHRTIGKWIDVTNPNVLSRTIRIHEEFFEGRFCLGVHRRVANAGVANLQRDGRLPSLNALLTRCDKLLQKLGGPHSTVFLATDDADAADAFKAAFGSRLVAQDNIKRTTASKPEVHFGDWREMSLTDAEDVRVDTLLLSRCNMLVHASSSVSTMASFLNPKLTLVRAYEPGSDRG
jgi:hypothetical protein